MAGIAWRGSFRPLGFHRDYVAAALDDEVDLGTVLGLKVMKLSFARVPELFGYWLIFQPTEK